MNARKCVVMALISFFVCQVSFGQQTVAQDAMTPKNKAELQQELRTLGQAFGVEMPKPTSSGSQQSQPSPEKTMAVVADKALDMVSGVTAKLSDQLQKVAPEVWRIMIRQQYANAIAEPLFPLGVMLCVFLFMLLGGRAWKYDEKEGWFSSADPTNRGIRALVMVAIPSVVICVTGIVAVYQLSYSIRILVNPEYYAIRDLLRVLINPASAG